MTTHGTLRWGNAIEKKKLKTNIEHLVKKKTSIKNLTERFEKKLKRLTSKKISVKAGLGNGNSKDCLFSCIQPK